MEQLKKTVVFVEGDYVGKVPIVIDGVPKLENGKPQFEAKTLPISGTAFLIYVPDPRLGPDQGLLYLVTNKHMVREPSEDGTLGAGKFLRSIKVRANTLNATAGTDSFITFGDIPVSDQQGNLAVLLHPTDPEVDLAVLPINIDEKMIDFKTLPVSIFATAEMLKTEKVDETTEVLFAGLFAPFPGSKKNYPIVRHGKLSMISSERVPWTPTTSAELYLADVMSFGGNSGSPVFLRLGGITDYGINIGIRYVLLGVMQGYFQVDSKVVVNTAKAMGTAAENTGVAAVVPAQKILDILQSPRAQASTDVRIAGIMQNAGQINKALDLYREAIETLSKLNYGRKDLQEAQLSYANALQAAGQYAQAAMERRTASKALVRDDTPDALKK